MNIVKVLFAILVLVAMASAVNKPGVIDGTTSMVPQSSDENLRSVADWYEIIPLDTITRMAGNWDILNLYNSKYMIKGIYNNSGSLAKVRFVTINPIDTIPMKIPAYGWSGKLPPAKIICKTGTSDSLLLFIQIQ